MRDQSGGNVNVDSSGDAVGHVLNRFSAVMTEFDIEDAGEGVSRIDSVWQGELRG